MAWLRRIPSLLLAFLLLLPLTAAAASEPDWDLTPLPDAWFDDAVFLGDSVSLILEKQSEQTGGLGEALFLCEGSFGINNAVSGNVLLWYQGRAYLPQDVLPLTGANKLFIMVGANDIALYGGIDGAMEMWDVFVDNVRETCPDILIFIESMLPVWYTVTYDGLNYANILIYNERLRDFCEERDCVYVDVADYFRDEHGGMALAYSSDAYVHITYAAADLWIEQLKNPANYSADPRSFSNGKDA